METAQPVESWAEFGRRLRAWRRQAGLTQSQLGLKVGYHHSLISRLEAGLREPPAGLAGRLDSVLGTGGELAAVVAAPGGTPYRPQRPPADPRLFAPVPGGGEAPAGQYGLDPVLWPSELPAEGLACPLHGTVGCAVPDLAGAPHLLDGLTASQGGSDGLPCSEPELLHTLTAVLACLIRGALHRGASDGLTTVERLLRALVRWAGAVNSTGRLPYGQLRLAAQYAQVAGRLRMQRGQSSIGMAWFGHGLSWADAVHDVLGRATLLSDVCTLVRLDRDAGSALAYAEAIGAVDPGRRWVVTLSHLYRARGHALGHDAAECRRHISLARRGFARLGRQDRLEAPWLSGAEGEMRVESAIGGALRDLAAVTGDRVTARRAVDATARSRAQLPPLMRETRVLLTLRLADCWACAGDPGAAVALAAPVLDEAVSSSELVTNAELRGLHGRLLARWGDVPEVREYRERLPVPGI
ncbi:helix-turn-helix domain-containing protein [Streptomyces fumanus]|uniref:Transcriptional regulator n=1 Tax=Streptomyces fumanus TaxID=67302 RepID=A0A919AES7_9ACTN|nr:helix-turn-helix transcriptional regulator [Streptomyces fumanus]GHE98708.1 transcriptional regulator [Streptomyces fumanus]